MASLFKFRYKPTPRCNHVAVAVGHRQFTWGGSTGDWDKSKKDARSVEVFDLSSEQWEKRPIRGSPPPGLAYAAYTTIGTALYSFGGYDGDSRHNSLHRLDLSSLEWKEVVPRNPSAAPQRKHSCQMVSFQDNKLVVFAGHTGDKRTDELHVFNLKEGTWSSPRTTGDKPPPCSSFTLTKINDHRAVMFGGFTGKHRLNDVFVLELGKWHWTKLPISGPKPPARSYHAACYLAGQAHPLLMVVGGCGGLEDFNDGWILDVDQRRWTKLDFPGEMKPRRDHTATVFGSAPGFRQVVLHGGGYGQLIGPTTATTLLNLELQKGTLMVTKRWMVTGVIPEDQLGRPEERLREKMEKLGLSPPPTQQTPPRAEERAPTLEQRLKETMEKLWPSPSPSPQTSPRPEKRAPTLREKVEKLRPSPPPIQQTSPKIESKGVILEQRLKEAESRAKEAERKARAAQETATTLEKQAKQRVQAESRATEQGVRLAQLHIMKTPKGEKVEVIKSLAVDWKSFGYLLDFDADGTVLNLIEKQHPLDPVGCCQEMFQKWLKGGGRQSATWERLIKLLEDIEHKHLAAQIKQALGL